MKNIKINLAVVAVILGTTMAMASVKPFEEAVYYNTAPLGQPTNWEFIPSGKTVNCDTNQSIDCSAEAGQSNVVKGNATLVDL